MVSVRRVAPILLLAVTLPVWAQTPSSTTSTATTTQKKSTTKKAATPAPASTTTASTTTATGSTTTTTSSTTTTTTTTKTTAKKAAATSKKPAATKAATNKEAAPATKRHKAAAKTAKASHPPRELHKVGDHWTAYNPPDPSTYPAGAKTYTIKAGDTLWALGKQFFNNAYLWPQLWEANTWITDAHWIYPGDVLLVEGEINQQATTTTGTTTGTTATGTGATSGQTTTAGGTAGTALGGPSTFRYSQPGEAVGGSAGPVALGTEKDLYCYGYIGDPNEPMPNRIQSWEDAEVRYQPGAARQEIDGAQGDLVFINGGTSTGLAAGETYMLVAPQNLIPHPVTKEIIGREYEFRGQVRILCADATKSRGLITQSCAEIPNDARLKPMPQIPIPLARIPNMPAFCDPSSGKTNGYIIASQGGAFLESLGDWQLVQVNLGRDDQVQPGDFLTVFRDANPGSSERQVLGELAVLTAEGHTATARIVLTRRAMRIGDRVEVR